MRFGTVFLVLAPFAIAACADRSEPVGPEAGPAPLLGVGEASGPLQDRYIVVFRDDVNDPSGLADELVRMNGGTIHYKYGTALKGFAATLPSQALEGIRRNPNVNYVETDGIMTADGSGTESPATWGIDRIDQRNLPLDRAYNYATSGDGVTVYIIDTGIRVDHAEFEGRAASGYDFVSNDSNADDCNGHGTHVAGTVGGKTYGVAQNVSLVAVRVLNCEGSGTTSGVIAGVNWVRGNHAAKAVANMSLGGGASTALDDAVNSSVDAGVVYAVAAGNSNANACNYSPARASKVITVGATTSTDARASYSNYGTCLELFAPGSSITSAWYTTSTATNTISGTSMASPHVAGAAALFWEANPAKTHAQVAQALIDNSTTGVVSSAGTGSLNRLLYTGSEPATPPPTVTVHLGGFSATSVTGKGNWKATVTTTVHQSPHVPHNGAVVTFGILGGSQTWSCTTTGEGACSVTVTISKGVSSVTFVMKGISGDGVTYDEGHPDSETIAKVTK